MTVASERPVSRSANVRSRTGIPVIDTDLHTIEFGPTIQDFVHQVGGAKFVDRFNEAAANARSLWSKQSWEERRAHRTAIPPWWTQPAKNTLDLATVSLPALLYDRLEEFGIDYGIVYPNITLFAPTIADEELRRVVVRAVNTYSAEVFRPYRDKLSPVAVIPFWTPEEAIEELEYAVNTLGLKSSIIQAHVRRPIKAIVDRHPELAYEAWWLDTFGVDSEYDYDPVWAKFVELKVAPTTHSVGMGWTPRRSVSNYTFNHIGHFASASDALAKSLFFGGVTKRFPTLKFGFIEGGVAWAASLLPDLVWHWVRRNPAGIEAYNPKNIDQGLLLDLYKKYGGKWVEGKLDQVGNGTGLLHRPELAQVLDDYARADIQSVDDIYARFSNFFIGVESDDPTIPFGFQTKANPWNKPLNAFIASDIGHWDVPDAASAIAETYELVERGIISEEEYKSLVFRNPARLYAGTNPDFFKGTAIENRVSELLKEESR